MAVDTQAMTRQAAQHIWFEVLGSVEAAEAWSDCDGNRFGAKNLATCIIRDYTTAADKGDVAPLADVMADYGDADIVDVLAVMIGWLDAREQPTDDFMTEYR